MGGCGRAVHHHRRRYDDYTGGLSVVAAATTTTPEKKIRDAAATTEGSRDDDDDGEAAAAAAAVTAESINTQKDEKIVTTEEEGGDHNCEVGEDEVPGMNTHDGDNTGSSTSTTSSTTANDVILGEEGSSPVWCDESKPVAAATGDTSTLDETTDCGGPKENVETEEGDLHRKGEDEVGVRTHNIVGSSLSTSATTEDVNVDRAPSSLSTLSSSLPAPAMLPPSTRKWGCSPPPLRMMQPTVTASLYHRSNPPSASRRAGIDPSNTTSRPNDDATSLSPSKAPRHIRVVGMFKILFGIIITLFVRGRRELGMWQRKNRNKLAIVLLLPALVASLPLLVFTGTTMTTTYHTTATMATTIPSQSSSSSFSAFSASYQKLRPPNSMPIERRGGGILTTHTACRISMWHWYPREREGRLGRKKDKVCDDLRELGQRVGHHLRDERMADVRHDDTIYVPFTSLDRFVYTFLPNVTVDVVVISGHPFDVRPASDDAIRSLLDSPSVVAWFCQNLPKYGGDDPYHVKVHPFPYGLNEKHNKLGLAILPAYKRVLFEGLNRTAFNEKNDTGNDGRNDNNVTSAIALLPPTDVRPTFVYAGPLKRVYNSDVRDEVPGTENDRLPPHEYFVRMSRSRYVLSPNGDRPECFRHYEALGLGVVPITELDPILCRYSLLIASTSNFPTPLDIPSPLPSTSLFRSHKVRHLSGGPVFYGNNEWNATVLEGVLDPRPVVNRNLIREDYWMGWMEDAVGRRLNWNDRLEGEEDKDGGNEDRGKKNNGLTDEENRLLASLGEKNNGSTDGENKLLPSLEHPARQRRRIVS